MLIRSIGHAGLQVSSEEATILVDPWFSPEGAFLASWFQYPSNEHLLSNEFPSPNAIVISHEHLDHVDRWFLEQVPANVPVFFPRYPSPALTTKILAGGDRPLVEVPEWEEREVAPGIRVFFVSEESPMNHDSAMVIRVGAETLLNMNDARLTASQLRRIRSQVGGRIDAVAIQGAGASWYPVCYQYDADQKRRLSISKRNAKLKYVAKTHELIEPTVSIPFAGPPAFLDESLRFANDEMGPEGIFPDQQQVADWMRAEAGIDNAPVLLPGDTWDTASLTSDRDGHWSGFDFNERDEYLDDYAKRRKPHIDSVHQRHPLPESDLYDEFARYFDRVLEMSVYFNEKIDMKVGFDITGPGGGLWSVDFRSDRLGLARNNDDCHYHYRFASRWLPAILSGEVPWEDFFLSLRFRAQRSPDLYNDHLLGLLKFAWPDALAAVETHERVDGPAETIDVVVDGVTYRIERFCPHGRQDLSETGEALPGAVLRCLGHHYEFDLATGECINGRSRPLQSTVIEVDDRTLTEPADGPRPRPPELPQSKLP